MRPHQQVAGDFSESTDSTSAADAALKTEPVDYDSLSESTPPTEPAVLSSSCVAPSPLAPSAALHSELNLNSEKIFKLMDPGYLSRLNFIQDLSHFFRKIVGVNFLQCPAFADLL